MHQRHGSGVRAGHRPTGPSTDAQPRRTSSPGRIARASRRCRHHHGLQRKDRSGDESAQDQPEVVSRSRPMRGDGVGMGAEQGLVARRRRAPRARGPTVSPGSSRSARVTRAQVARQRQDVRQSAPSREHRRPTPSRSTVSVLVLGWRPHVWRRSGGAHVTSNATASAASTVAAIDPGAVTSRIPPPVPAPRLRAARTAPRAALGK